MWSIGLMTGTVLDGNIDVAAIRTDGDRILELGPLGEMDRDGAPADGAATLTAFAGAAVGKGYPNTTGVPAPITGGRYARWSP
jgi:1,6-anhydro-N-acetylmuramate kinase